jgi:hypothetical protein
MNSLSEDRRRFMLPTEEGELARYLLVPATYDIVLETLEHRGYEMNSQIAVLPPTDANVLAIIRPFIPAGDPAWSQSNSELLTFEPIEATALPSLLALLNL